MLPPKWKIFHILNYLNILGVIVILCAQSYVAISTADERRESGMYFYLIIVFLCLSAAIANSIVNIYLINRYYPGHLPEKWLRNLSIILYIPTILLVILYSIVLVYIQVTAQTRISERGTHQLIASTGVLVFICSGIYILWNQASLRKELTRNYKAAMETFLEEKTPA